MAADESDQFPAQPTRHAQADRVVAARDKTFQNGPVTLSGSLYAPRSKVRIPAVIVLHPASSPDRDRSLYRHLIEMLPSLNIAVFVRDRRGTGESGGRLEDSDYELLAADGIRAQRMLSADRRIDASRIGFRGLGQGGWLAMLAASRSPAGRAALSIYGSAVPWVPVQLSVERLRDPSIVASLPAFLSSPIPALHDTSCRHASLAAPGSRAPVMHLSPAR